ncbi:MAG: SDR family NAD(P)-dependent oxidoreductase [Bauldia sp.]
MPAPFPGEIATPQERTAVITGGTSGIGLECARALARLGWRLAIVGHDHVRGAAAVASLNAAAPEAKVAFYCADLADIREVERLAAKLLADLPRIDVLVNNAGSFFLTRQVSPQGLERTFALNHMAYFVLAERLRDRLVASAPARIVNVASEAHRGARIDFDDLQSERRYGGWRAYQRSKLCNILHAKELARRLAETGVSVYSLHPGFVASRFGDDIPGLPGLAWRVAKRLRGISAVEGAATMIHLATSASPGGASGAYFEASRPVPPDPAADDAASARRLWEVSDRIATRTVDG